MGLKDTIKSFENDIEKTITNKEEKASLKGKFNSFKYNLLEDVNDLLEYKEDEVEKLKESVEKITGKMEKMQEVIKNIEKDIYAEEGFDFEIVCPYCNEEFIIDVDENKTEIECPSCNNIIELDWSGNIDEEDTEIDSSCGGSCYGCNGCGSNYNEDENNEDKYEDEDM